MFIFQYNGLRDRLLKEYEYNTTLIKAGLASIVEASKEYIGQNVVVIFDNTRDEHACCPIGSDLVNSTFRQGILKEITQTKKVKNSVVLFEDPSNGKKILTPIYTKKLIDLVSVHDLSYPVQSEDPELSTFFFKFFYHRRGESGMLHSHPLGAFVDGRSRVIRPGSECKQAYFTGFHSLSPKIALETEVPERCTSAYEKRFREGTLPSQKNYIIRCGKRN
jgi:hypothetical protein